MTKDFSNHIQHAPGRNDSAAQLVEQLPEEIVEHALHSDPLAFETRGVKLAALQSLARLAKSQGGEWTMAKVCSRVVGGQNIFTGVVDDVTAKVSYTLHNMLSATVCIPTRLSTSIRSSFDTCSLSDETFFV